MKYLSKSLGYALALALLVILAATLLPAPSQADDDVRFYRGTLDQIDPSGKLTTAYDAIAAAIGEAQTTIDVSALGLDRSELSLTVNAVLDDCPELFWFRGSYSFSFNPRFPDAVLSLTPTYYFTGDELAAAQKAFDARVAEIMEGITASMSVYQKEKYIHDTLATSVVYEYGEHDQSAYSALVEHQSVCAGYTRAFQLCLQKLGIQCLYVPGWARTDTELHAWAIVRLDGEYYHVDLTWDDAVWNFEPLNTDNPEDVSSIFYSYFNINDEKLFTDNRFLREGEDGYMEYLRYVPACTGTKYNYYSQNHTAGRIVKIDDSTTIEDLSFALQNPVDDATRVFYDDSYGQEAAIRKLDSVMQSGYSQLLPVIGNKGSLRFRYTYPVGGHDIQLHLSGTDCAVVHGNVFYDGDPADKITVTVSNSEAKVLSTKEISGIGASYIFYGLPAGTLTVTASTEKNNMSQAVIVDVGDFVEADIRLEATGTPGGSDDPGTPGDPDDPGTPGDPDDPGTPGDPDDPQFPEIPITDGPVAKLFGEIAGAIRSSGESRYETAIETANKLKTALGIDKFDSIIVASSHNFPDALAGSYLAARKNAPILIVRATDAKNGLDLAVDYIRNNLSESGTVYILGGTSAVTEKAETAIRAAAKNVKRLAGSDRYATNLLILREAGIDNGAVLLVADGRGFADALSASALGMPIMLINNKKDRVSAEQEKFMDELGKSGTGLSKIVVLGGQAAVPDAIKYDFSSRVYPGVLVDRIDGSSRYETSANIAAYFFEDPQAATLATGVNFPDGLTGGSLAYALRAPLILTRNKDKDVATAAAYIGKAGIERFVVFGGASALPDSVISAISGK